MARTIGISATGSHVVVRLSANNALQTGATFGIWDPTGMKLIEQWTMSAGVAGYSDHTVGTPPDQLCDCSLTWRIIVCSHDPNITIGDVDVLVFQAAQPCLITPPAHYHLPNVPECAGGTAIPIQGSGDLICG